MTRRPALIALVALLALYGLTYRGNIGVIDEATMLGVTVSLVERRTLALNALYPALLPWGAPVPFGPPGELLYARYGLGQSLLALPLYVAGGLLPFGGTFSLNGYPFAPLGPFFAALLLNSVATLLAVMGVFCVARALDASPRAAGWAALLYGVTTMAWPYAKTFYSGPTTAAALVWMVCFAVRYRRHERPRDGLLAGAALGAAILLRPINVLVIPALFAYLLPDDLRVWRDPRALLRRWLAPGAFTLCGVAVQVWYNVFRFGRPFASGYEPGLRFAPWEAWLGFLVSPGRSVFLYNPLLLLAIPGAVMLARRLRRETVLLGAVSVGHAFVYGFWHEWHAGQSLGPRYLLPALPLLTLLVLPVLSRMDRTRWRWAVVGLGGLGFLVQAFSNLANPNDTFYESVSREGLPVALFNWRVSRSFFANQWPAYLRHGIDSILLRQLPIADPYALAGLYFALVCGLAALMVWAVLRLPDAAPAAPGSSSMV